MGQSCRREVHLGEGNFLGKRGSLKEFAAGSDLGEKAWVQCRGGLIGVLKNGIGLVHGSVARDEDGGLLPCFWAERVPPVLTHGCDCPVHIQSFGLKANDNPCFPDSETAALEGHVACPDHLLIPPHPQPCSFLPCSGLNGAPPPQRYVHILTAGTYE